MYIFQPDRYLITQQIKKYAPYVKGKVLDVGAGSFNRYDGLFDCDQYLKMDIQAGENINVVGSAEKIPFSDDIFDAIVCTQILGDIKNLNQAIGEFYRVLKPGGLILLTESFFDGMHDEPNDFWRFTNFGLDFLFQEAGFKIIAIDQRGGFFSAIAQSIIRYLIERLNLYRRRWAKFLKPFIAIFGKFMIFLDKLDKSKANKKFAIGWCILAKK